MMMPRVPSPTVRILGRRVVAFHLGGYVGLAAALAVSFFVVVSTRRSMPLMLLLAAASVATFLALAALTKAVMGRESLTYYHHQFAILCVAASIAALSGRGILPFLDATMLGVGAFLVFGRLGCLMAGCCYGRPFPRGIRYTQSHAEGAFPHALVGVRLIPVQAIEAAWVAGVVAFGVVIAVSTARSGLGLAWYLELYAFGRFFLETLRGDAGRPFLWGLSEGQWISVVTAASVAGAGLADVLPFAPWQPALAAALALAAAALLVRVRLDAGARVRTPAHLLEIARAVEASAMGCIAGGVRLIRTSQGLLVSAGRSAGTFHVTASRQRGRLSPPEVAAISRYVARLRGMRAPDAQPRRDYVMHLVFHDRD